MSNKKPSGPLDTASDFSAALFEKNGEISKLTAENRTMRAKVAVVEQLLRRIDAMIPADVARQNLTPVDLRQMLVTTRAEISATQQILSDIE